MASFLSLPAISARPIPRAFSLKGPFFQTPTTLHFKNNRFAVNCRYAEAGVGVDSTSTTIDVVADVKSERIVVLGGSGFVGSAICKAAVSKGIEVISLSRSGRPTYPDAWVDQVTWISGDVFYVNWDEVLGGATAVVSTLGGFGTEEQMRKINGEANVVAVNAAKEFGIPKFILISVHDYNLPSFLLSSGYFTGKRKAESEVLSKYPNSDCNIFRYCLKTCFHIWEKESGWFRASFGFGRSTSRENSTSSRELHQTFKLSSSI
ncbi:uncharacterized protein At1g32220, chloroplastic isoform X2 [Gastrolobium bilobum]|uniref:uncharacterized protein At1g32220, chloroplastic isoform X2 n=1 Tax=Gastrolobium bilobum TaxID=150636 RepID=UPI002AB15A96|nr:uncharacterized protein At1g32220, chloroplastic isoform X2 [Gastrolobium bilobum]